MLGTMLAAACGSKPICEEGDIESCTCPGGGTSQKVCSILQQWSPCYCTVGADGGATADGGLAADGGPPPPDGGPVADGGNPNNPFRGSCLAPFFDCFAPEGAKNCTYNTTTRELRLTWVNGAYLQRNIPQTDVKAISAGSQYCFTITAGAAPNLKTYWTPSETYDVKDMGSYLEITCPNQVRHQLTVTDNPADMDLYFDDGNSDNLVCPSLSCRIDDHCPPSQYYRCQLNGQQVGTCVQR